MLFSVIMPAYNRAQYVGDALQSVLDQEFQDWECIVVDDGSTDGTPEIVREFASKDARFRLIQRQNGGPGAARNTGAEHATGRYLAFLDSDDLWMPYAMETCSKALDHAGWPEYLAASIQLFSDNQSFTMSKRGPLLVDKFPDAIAACHSGVVASVPLTVVSLGAFRRVGGFLEDRLNAEDHDLTLRLGECQGFAVVRSPVTVAYRVHEDQEISSQPKAVAGMLRMVDRERAGTYAGGVSRALQRRNIIATHARPVCLAAIRSRDFGLAVRLYLATMPWQIEAKRWRFLAAFPFILFQAAFKRRRSGATAVGMAGGMP